MMKHNNSIRLITQAAIEYASTYSKQTTHFRNLQLNTHLSSRATNSHLGIDSTPITASCQVRGGGLFA